MTEPAPKLADLLETEGVNATRVHRVLAALSDGAWWTPRELVRTTAVAHRLVVATLDALGTELERRESDDGPGVRLLRPTDHGTSALPELADPVAHLCEAHSEAAAELRRLVSVAPRSRRDLDHVAATPETALRRAMLLGARFSLPGAHVLFVGDHDLTSLAATMVHPEVTATVVDIDERMLEFIDGAAARLGLRVRCHFADLRLALPAAVRGQHDIALTDPPYTPEGVTLFVRRAVSGLAEPRNGRVLLAYGASETTPGLTAKTQSALTRMGLVFEAVWPEFNRYLGAEAIGAASDLYLLRPTNHTPGGQDTRDPHARIYSQGAAAREAGEGLARDPAAAGTLLRESDADTAVGAWPRDALPQRGVRHVRLATWLASPTRVERAAIDLTGGWEALLGRAILAGGAESQVVVAQHAPQVRDAAGQRALRAMLAPRFELSFRDGVGGSGATVVVARERDRSGDSTATGLIAYCQDRAHGVLANTLREGIISVATSREAALTKKEARSRVAAAAPWLSGHTLLDLPAHRFADLRAAAERLVTELR